MRVRIVEDERCPDYHLRERGYDEQHELLVDVSSDLLAEYLVISARYDELQKKLRNLYIAAEAQQLEEELKEHEQQNTCGASHNPVKCSLCTTTGDD